MYVCNTHRRRHRCCLCIFKYSHFVLFIYHLDKRSHYTLIYGYTQTSATKMLTHQSTTKRNTWFVCFIAFMCPIVHIPYMPPQTSPYPRNSIAHSIYSERIGHSDAKDRKQYGKLCIWKNHNSRDVDCITIIYQPQTDNIFHWTHNRCVVSLYWETVHSVVVSDTIHQLM